MKKPRVSVVVPICNVEKYVYKCLESLKHQTMSEFEVICVDDGSTDSSGQIADDIATSDDRFRVIHKKNSGYGHTMNVGIQNANAEYLAILESDDFAAEDMLEKLYKKAEETRAQIVKANFYEYQGDENVTELKNSVGVYSERGVFSPSDFPEFMLDNPAVWNAIYRIDFLKSNDIRFLESPGASYQDVSFLCKCWYIVDRVACIDDPVVYYRIDNPNSSIRNRRKVYCICDEYNEVKKYIRSHPKAKARAELVMAQMMFSNYYHSYMRIDFPFKYGFVTKWREDTLWLRDNGFMGEQVILKKNDRRTMENLMADLDTFYDNISEYNWFIRSREKWQNWECIYKSAWNEMKWVYRKKMNEASDIVIFGAGKVAHEAIEVLERMGMADKIRCICVTERAGNPESYNGISIYDINSIPGEYRQDLVIIALKISSQKEAMNSLKENGFANTINYAGEARESLREVLKG